MSETAWSALGAEVNDRAVHRASMKMRTAQSLKTLPVVALTLIALEFALSSRVEVDWLHLWVALIASTTLARALVCLLLHPLVEAATPELLDRYERWLWWSLLANTVALGSGFWLVAGHGDTTARFVLTLVSCFYAIGSLVNASSHFPSFAVGVMLNLGQGVLFWSGLGAMNPSQFEVAVPFLAVALLMIGFGRDNARQFAMSVLIRRENVDLLDQLGREKSVVDRALEDARQASSAKSRFLAAASHDLRQPMHAIGLMVGMLRERVGDPTLRRMADRTHQAVDAMERMFSDLLDVSKLDAGAVTPRPRRFAAQELLQRIEHAYAPLAADKGLGFRVRPTPLWLESDPLLLERIVANFVTNALRYTRRGGVLVACRARAGGAQLVVFDTGIGVAEAQRGLIFEEFVRLGDEGGEERGLGLGLSIVQRTAALLGHAVSVRSQPGRGSAFAISVPVVPPQTATVAAEGETAPRLAGAFVLVVDNDADNREATAQALRFAGCLVVMAADAEAALAEVAGHLRPLDLIVTDLRLGAGADGLGLVRELGNQAGGAVPALLVTAEVRVPDDLPARTAVLRKPVALSALLEAASGALAGV